MNKLALSMVMSVVLSATVLVACHAAEDDPAGQAGELRDPVRRANAIRNLQKIWSKALRDGGNDRNSDAVRGVLDQVVETMSSAYIENRMDNQNGLAMLDLLKEMRDPRSLPALIEALDWRAEVNEDHAIRAAQTLQFIDVPEDKKADVVRALATAVEKVRQARPIDNRMRIEMIRALGSLETRAATPALVKIATTQTEEQNFLINRLAAQELGRLGDPEAVDAMIQGLFLFAPSNPAMRMNDVAAESLVRIGRPALQPLLALLRGDNAAANAIAEAYIAAVRQRNAEAAAQMSVAQVVGEEATFALGSLGLPDAFDALYAETTAEDTFRKVNGAIALVKLTLNDAQVAQVRDRLRSIYQGTSDDFQGVAFKAQLIAAMRSLYDPGFLPFFLTQIGNADLHPQVRIEAVSAYAMLANKTEMQGLTTWLARNTNDAYHENFSQAAQQPSAVADACDADLACYLGKLDDANKEVVRKAAFMVGRLGRDNADAIAKLTEKLSHGDLEVRLAAVSALDRVATSGAPAAVEKINELRTVEEGRAIWSQFSRQALPVAARLIARGSAG
ncbi:MAG: HEAT repeat domain-containing protein [Myxococcales bacterium]|nr:HEAT repeat domain-containing protein [Myxococcales bacterium]